MSSLIKKQWYWELIKLMIEQSVRHYQEGPFIRQEMIENIKKHSYEIKKILKKGRKVQANLNQAINQFNFTADPQEIDDSIVQCIHYEREIEITLNEANDQLREILWKKKIPSDI
ncbi:hypothetical protein [Garciella nitratireducens]|uniref:Uncharacterized protein n=1 Tax=Garciella nitratireducens DSM 15102 TaxID=1121911 RepID=A0A1T4NX10_9FIRM|nr:hypothetical protein [Garciella nitratireducens]RBP46926.1 hypothetical protein DFR81_101337 [Garciella nitratireducens]SJZ83582.1 hypothetical protein SAMN02745973_01831 [Garciella nitratireducens DSM 15102]